MIHSNSLQGPADPDTCAGMSKTDAPSCEEENRYSTDLNGFMPRRQISGYICDQAGLFCGRLQRPKVALFMFESYCRQELHQALEKPMEGRRLSNYADRVR